MRIDEELTESLLFRVKGKAGGGDALVGVCYRPPDRENYEAFYKQVGAASFTKYGPHERLLPS